jgi:aspartokinase-like uncharacterized kinase
MIATSGCVVVKVGGSLFDLPDLGLRLNRWLDSSSLRNVLLVPGGGATTDLVRAWDRQARLGEEVSHWLALRGLSLNAHFLAAIVPHSLVVDGPHACAAVWSQRRVAVLDCLVFAATDETRPSHLPHTWAVTSDCVAARAAVVAEARQLVLLKSRSFPEPIDWRNASRQGLVDEFFPTLMQASGLQVSCVNFRAWRP